MGQAPASTRFVARTGNYRLDLSPASSRVTLKNAQGGMSTLKLSLTGANGSASWQQLEPLPTRANYFRGRTKSEWHTDIPTFGRVREHNLYPGIDLVYYGSNDRLEYDFVLAPHADPARIRMRYEGAESIRIDRSGNLILHTAHGDVTQYKPVLYQSGASGRSNVSGAFVLRSRNEVSFAVGPYDRSRELTIDPTISFASYLGGGGSDQGNGIAVDTNGNSYLIGSTTSGSADSDFLLRKYSPTGTQIYLADFGGSRDDFGNAIRVDSTGSVYVGGRTTSDDFPTTMDAFQPKRAGNADAFLLRVNPAGNSLVFSTYIGTGADDFVSGIAIDTQGAVYATGTTGGNFPSSLGSFQATNRGGLDAFVIKLDNQGNGVYSTLLGGGSDDEGRAIAVDTNGNAYVTGTTLSDSFPERNTIYQNSRHGDVDAFLTSVNSLGTNLNYSTFFGGAFSDQGYAVAVDASNAVYVAGKTASRDLATRNAYQKDYAGGDNDIFIAKFQPGKADVDYVTYLGSGGSDEAFGLAVDSTGAAYITGDTDSDRYPTTNDATQFRRNGNREAVLTKLNPQGNALVFSTYLGGSNNDIGYGVALDTAGNAYVTGITSSTDFPVTQGAFQTQAGGGGNADAFFIKYQFATVTGAPTVTGNGIVNGANFAAGPVAPGSVISIFGTNFIASAAGATNVPLPTNLGGVSALINGTPAPLFYVGPGQINAQVPYSVGPGAASLQVNAPNGTSSTVQFQVAQAAPYLNSLNGRAIAVDTSNNLITPQNPARVGSTVVVYFTGVGPVTANPTTGAGSPAGTSTLQNFATIGGATATLAYLGLTPQSVGLAQANIRIPNLSAGDYPVLINIGGVNSNTALIAVAP